MEDWESFKMWCTIIVCAAAAIWFITGIMTPPPPEPDYEAIQAELRHDDGAEIEAKLDQFDECVERTLATASHYEPVTPELENWAVGQCS